MVLINFVSTSAFVILFLPASQLSQSVSLSSTAAPSRSLRVSNEELSHLTENLFSLEGPNNAADLVTVYPAEGSSPLLKVNPAAYKKPTIEKLLLLHDNYVANVKDEEVATPEEGKEENDFLNAVLVTPIMQATQNFLISKGFILLNSNSSNPNGTEADQLLTTTQRAFRSALHEIWFTFYSRNRGTLGSSGFEHVFLGETKKGKVSGLHNWVFFSSQEEKNNAKFNQHQNSLQLGSKGSIIKLRFNWLGKIKPVSSMFVGTSPELELALYTVCFYARPRKHCPVVLDGKHFTIQTHFINDEGNGHRLVASAYPEI